MRYLRCMRCMRYELSVLQMLSVLIGSPSTPTTPAVRQLLRSPASGTPGVHAQHCIIPAEAFFEPDWRSGRAVPTRISRGDGEPLGIAGLWATWRAPTGKTLYSYTMLTINADEHPIMRQFHKPGDEKRMVVVLSEDKYDDWLVAGVARSQDFLLQYPAERLRADACPAR